MIDDPGPLTFVPVGDLIAEIERRFAACLIVYLEDRGGKTMMYQVSFDGGIVPCVGLAEAAKHYLLNRDDNE